MSGLCKAWVVISYKVRTCVCMYLHACVCSSWYDYVDMLLRVCVRMSEGVYVCVYMCDSVLGLITSQ